MYAASTLDIQSVRTYLIDETALAARESSRQAIVTSYP